MILDISSNQGKIDWQKVSTQDVTKVILRSTTQNGKLDVRTLENYNGILQNMNGRLNSIDFYKFSYVRDYTAARIESMKTLDTMKRAGIRLEVMDTFYLDLEGHGGRDYTKDEASRVILGYFDTCLDCNVNLGLYFNYNYAKNIVDPIWRELPLWIARYNDHLGNVDPWQPELWQYTSKGHVDGIIGNVDISMRVNYETIS